MIERLKSILDEVEDKPKLKALILKVAEMPENKQEQTLQLIEMMINTNNQ